MGNLGLIIIVVLFVAAFTALLTWVQAQKKAEVWQGTVTKIKHKTVNEAGTDECGRYEDYVDVHYRTDQGKKGKLTLRKHAFNQQFPDLQVSDRLKKEAGEYVPKKA